MSDNKEVNNNKIETILLISYSLKIFKLIIIILNLSYIVGMSWLIICEFNEDFILDVQYKDIEDPAKYFDAFIP
jgi:hypothetical protein